MRARRLSWRRAGPTLLAALLAAAYLIVRPRSPDLADALFRVRLFGGDPLGIWDTLWYAGHSLPGYSVLMPPLGWLLGARLLGALAAVATAAAGEVLAYRHDPERGWMPAMWFAAGTVTELMSGRIAFLLGLLFVVLVAVALQDDRRRLAPLFALLSALASPVAALFAALAGAAVMLAPQEGRVEVGARTVLGALVPIVVLNILFPQGGVEPFAASAFWPIPVLGALTFVAAIRADRPIIAAGAGLYVVGTVIAFLLHTAVGGNAVRLGQLAAGPVLLVLVLDSPRPLVRSRRLTTIAVAILAVPLVYLQWQSALRDTIGPIGDPSTTAAYYTPLIRFLTAHDATTARTEIPFTKDHWEAYWVGRRFPLARGWERQLDERDNPLFYTKPDHPLTDGAYDAWLHRDAVRWVALPLGIPLDGSATQEAKLIERHPSFLRLVLKAKHWRIYAVRHPTPLATGTARVVAQTQSSVTLLATRIGASIVRVRYSPYWQISGMPGCVAPDGAFTRVSNTRRGRFRMTISFALDRIATRSPRCNKS